MNQTSKKQPNLFSSLKKVSGWTGLSRLFGLFRDIATTGLLGASYLHDIFIVILKIPNLFRRFFAEGAFNQAFIPVYSDYYKENNERLSKEFLNPVISISRNGPAALLPPVAALTKISKGAYF